MEETPATAAISHEDIIEKFRKHQDWSYALIGGALSALVCAVIWAIITVSIERQIGYMAIGVGFLVGITVRYFGAGIDKKFGVIGAVFALLGCMLGNLFSQLGFAANAESVGYIEVLSFVNLDVVIQIFKESFNPMDLFFYALAAYEGYIFSFRKMTEDLVQQASETEGDVTPENIKYRMPLALGSLALLAVLFFVIQRGVSSTHTYTYESGKKKSEGEVRQGKMQGPWTFWHENGKVNATGNYEDGMSVGEWKWYDEEGHLIKQGHYNNDVEEGVWVVYYPNGVAKDSGNYEKGRMTGFWIGRFESGQISVVGEYERNFPNGKLLTYHENGKLRSEANMVMGDYSGDYVAYFADGRKSDEYKYVGKDSVQIINVWDSTGKQLVTNGEGTFVLHHPNGKIAETGLIKGGLRTGTWKTHFANGALQEEGRYEGYRYYLINQWGITGKQYVTNGNGIYYYYPEGTDKATLTGGIMNGLKEGKWTAYYQTTGTVSTEMSYEHGILSGPQKAYLEDGSLATEGSYADNKQTGPWTWYHPNGVVSSTATYVNGKKEGKQVIWSESGKETRNEYYKDGKLEKEEAL